MHEVKRLKEEVIELKGKEQVRPSQDNRDSMVKKLEKGSNITSSTSQQDQKSIKHKISRKKSLGHIKCYSVTPGLQKDINQAIIYVPGSSHTYIFLRFIGFN